MRLYVRTGRHVGVTVGVLGALIVGVGWALYLLVRAVVWLLTGLVALLVFLAQLAFGGRSGHE